MDSTESSPINTTTKFSAAVQITRPKSATKPGSSSLANSPINQVKVAKLVLKPAQQPMSKTNSTVNKPTSPQKREISTSIARTQTALESLRLNQKNRNKAVDEASMKQHQQTAELEMKTRKAENERKALSQQQQQAAEASPKHKSMDEAARSEAREYMKKQKEKRKLETKQEIDKTFVIRQRLDELRKTTRNVITNKPKMSKSQVKLSPPKDYFSLNNVHMKEIKVLKLKPMSAKSQKTPEIALEDLRLNKKQQEIPDVLERPKSPVRPTSPGMKPASPLQLHNRQNSAKPEIVQRTTRPSPAKENQKPHDNLKLTVPNVKLSMTTLNRTEVAPSAYQSFMQPQPKVPFWLQNSAIQPYPYNFIWAVRKKLEAYTSNDAVNREEKSRVLMDFETPARKVNKQKKTRRFPDFSTKHHVDDSKNDLQRPTIGEDSEPEIVSEANTTSEISSIKSDMAAVKSQSQEKEQQRYDEEDDTTISESIFHSLKDDAFVGKRRESVNSNFDRTSFGKKTVELENVSPNTTAKRLNFLSSTRLEITTAKPEVTDQNDLDNNKLNQEKEEEYQKMLKAFNQSLSHVIEVNQVLSTVLSSKSSSVASSQTSGTVRNYTSSFEKNVDSERKTSNESNISEMIENLVQQSKPAPAPVDALSDSNSSIQTFIEDSKSTTLKPENFDDAIEDPPIVYNEPAQEISSSITKVTTTTTTTEFLQQQKLNEKKEEPENTLNESNMLMNVFKYSESETSFNITLAENNASFGMLMDKSSSEIKSWERTLIDRTRGQIAWLELQKQKFRKNGQVEKISAIKKQQRAILLRLEKERSKLRESSERSSEKAEEDSAAKFEDSLDMTLNESAANARQNIERILQQREQKIIKRRAQVEHLVNWQRKLDKEEEKLKQMEQELLGANMKKLSSSPRKKKIDDDLLNTSIRMVKSIDKSLMILDNIEPSKGEETIDVIGAKLNKLWHRLTGIHEMKYQPTEIYCFGKREFAQLYEDAKEFVLCSDLKLLLETSAKLQQLKPAAIESEKKEIDEKHDDDVSDVSTMNSIANIETEEEYPGSHLTETEPETATPTVTENDDELRQMFANQMKVFLDHKKPAADDEVPVKEISVQPAAPTIDNTTFQIQSKTPLEALDKSSSSIGETEMEIEPDSLIQTEPLLSIDNSAVDADGSIIPEVNEIQITDMDQDNEVQDQLIEDISFPNLELSDDTMQHDDDNNRNDLSTITECTEYEQSQGSSIEDEVSSEILSHASTATTSERNNSEIEKRLISINDSMEEVNEAFKKVAIVNLSPSTATYSTDKDFLDSPKASTSESDEKTNSNNLLMFSPSDSDSTLKSSGTQITTSTPKILMPEILSSASERTKNDDQSDDF